jgi:hypothetical protein
LLDLPPEVERAQDVGLINGGSIESQELAKETSYLTRFGKGSSPSRRIKFIVRFEWNGRLVNTTP